MKKKTNSKKTTIKDTGCCPPFDAAAWQNKTITWKNKLFIRDRVKTFFYMPLNFTRVMTRMFNAVTKTGGRFMDGLVLSDHTSFWNMDIYAAIDKRIRGQENVTLSGKFFTRVYEGSHNETG